MGRWRPPQAKSSAYITPAGMQTLKAELDELWYKRRPDVVKAITAAAAEGDRSENAEYIYRKKELAGIDRRVRYLKKRIPDLKVIDTAPSDPNKIYFGAIIVLEDENGDEHRYQIVGPDEFDLQKGQISMDAPLAKLLMGKTLDDEVVLNVAESHKEYVVLGISYL